MWCPGLRYSTPKYPVFPVGCSQRNTQDWTPEVKDSLCKTAVEYLPGNSSSRHSVKVPRDLTLRTRIILSHKRTSSHFYK
ncbi:hypothetical protein TNCV_1864711 [Trichonephila clavipes]|nr:hypothetical protein TNCV_1864711 [Trichonephila clavipes]